MTEREVRLQIQRLLAAQAEALTAIRLAHSSIHDAFKAHDAALISAIEANSAALTLLDRIINEGVTPDDES